jgi:hypothetical protein
VNCGGKKAWSAHPSAAARLASVGCGAALENLKALIELFAGNWAVGFAPELALAFGESLSWLENASVRRYAEKGVLPEQGAAACGMHCRAAFEFVQLKQQKPSAYSLGITYIGSTTKKSKYNFISLGAPLACARGFCNYLSRGSIGTSRRLARIGWWKPRDDG